MIPGALLLESKQLVADPGDFYRKRTACIIPGLLALGPSYLVGVRIGMRGEELSVGRTLKPLLGSFALAAIATGSVVFTIWHPGNRGPAACRHHFQ